MFEELTATLANGQKVPIEYNNLANGIEVPYPTTNQSLVVEDTILYINSSNSNLVDVLSQNPLTINYRVRIESMNQVGFKSFAREDSFFDLDINVEIPFEGKAQGFYYERTEDFNIEDFDGADEADFKLLAENNIPLDIRLQMYFLDAGNQVIDSLFSNTQTPVLFGAPIDASGLANGSTKTTLQSIFRSERFNGVKDAIKTKTTFSLNTPGLGSTSVILSEGQDITISTGVKLKYD